MGRFEQAMERASARAQERRGRLVDEAMAEYFRALPPGEFPRADAAEAATRSALAALRTRMWEPEWLAAVPAVPAEDEARVEAARLSFLSLAPGLHMPPPTGTMELHPRSMGYAAALGATLGLLAMLGLSRFIGGPLERVDLGVVISAPLGAFIFVLGAGWLSRHKRILRLLQAALGVATAAELWLAVTSAANPLAGLWRRLRGRHSSWGLLKRLLAYVAVILMLQMVVRRPTFQRPEHEAVVRRVIEQWIEAATRLQAALLAQDGDASPAADGDRAHLAALAPHLYAIRDSTAAELPVAAAEMLQEARNAGFEGLDGDPGFLAAQGPQQPLTWNRDLAARYDTFGHVEEGDPVTVEREAVVRAGEVIVRGLVRRLREGAGDGA